MIKKLTGTLMVCIFVFCYSPLKAYAFFPEGNFRPYNNAQVVNTESKTIYYQIKPGDTLWGISRSHNIDLKLVMSMNNLDENSILGIGQIIKIPYERARSHVVKKGDTLWNIAQRYEVEIGQLMNANRGKDPHSLQIGDIIFIPGDNSIALPALSSASRGITPLRSVLLWPLIGSITSNFGWRASGFHHGIDIAGNIGDPIRSAEKGKVVFADYRPVYGYTVIIEHNDGRQTVYAHAKEIMVKKNQVVNRGDIVATVGLSGNTTGPHLHFEVRKGNEPVDPLTYLR
ncbi:MAG: peptidoglycan DD-metalloendopeptidase family protein [Syntrophomonadaceae bacterium]|jgi:murein DD-endopeptidase MepM/ murein hydrolase activator NlpD